MITGINESKTLTKHISCECKCRFDGEKCNSWWNSRIMINVDVSVKNVIYVKKIMFGIQLHVIVIIDADVDNKSNDKAKSNNEINFNEKKAT